MIREITIENFAIIDHIHVEFEEGMTVMTGETGAGKSIIIDAIGQLLGERSSASLVKSGKNKAYIEAILDMNDVLEQLLEAYHIKVEDILTISKEIAANGRTVCKINYKTVSNNVLNKLGSYLIDIHSQFENQSLLNPKNDLNNLDSFFNDAVLDIKNNYLNNYKKYLDITEELQSLNDQAENMEQLDFYRSQLEEINQFDFENESIEDLEKENEYMKSFEKINQSLSKFKQLMNADHGIMDLLYEATDALKVVEDYDDFKEIVEKFNDCYFMIQDNKEAILDRYEDLSFDEYHFNEVQQKLYTVSKLKRKYGPGVEDILEAKHEIEQNINMLENRDNMIQDCQERLGHQMQVCLDIASIIHDKRMEIADDLSRKITSELHSLYMNKAIFRIDVVSGDLNRNGFDEVHFMISTNAGMPLQPLSKIVSGGELSRIMLAMKCIMLENDPVESIIFDEVDTGVSGKVADAIGSKMGLLSDSKQVICITHLPQVASYAAHHLYIYKTVEDDITATHITQLDHQQRIEEIAKMLSGENISEAALEQARILLDQHY